MKAGVRDRKAWNMEIFIEGCKIAYKESGAGDDVVVILQGWGTNMAAYDSVAACVNAKYRVIQFDFPGFGDSDEPGEAWAVEDYARFFLKFMEALHIQRATLIGHSYGGRVIIRLAARPSLPFEIQRIVLIDSAGILPQKTWKQKMRIKAYKVVKKLVSIWAVYAICPEFIDEWKSRQGSADYRNASPVMRQCLVKAVNEDLTGLLKDVRQDVLLIWGDQDAATPLSDGKLMERLMPQAGLAVMKGAGHFSFLDQPAVFGRIMASYFNMGDSRGV